MKKTYKGFRKHFPHCIACVFEAYILVRSTNVSSTKNALQCGKCMRKRDVATQPRDVFLQRKNLPFLMQNAYKIP